MDMNPTREQRVILLVANWLKRYAVIFPMYGKALEDARLEEFLDEFRSTDPEALDAAFKAARGTCTEFPTPADVRKYLPGIVAQLRQEAETREILSRPGKPLLDGEVSVEEFQRRPDFKEAVANFSMHRRRR